MVEKIVKEERFVLKSLNEWRSAKKSGLFPTLDQMHKTKISKDWQKFFVLVLAEDPAEWHFTHVGEELRKDHWEDHYYNSIQQISERSLIHEAIVNIPIVMNKRSPFSFSGQKVNKDSTTMYRMILMPIGDKSDEITMILGGVSMTRFETRSEAMTHKYNTVRASSKDAKAV